MKVIIYSLNYAPEMIGIGKYNTELAAWLTKKGHEVLVICAPPYYPSWKLQQGYSGHRYTSESKQSTSLSIHRCPIWIPKSPTGLKRVMHLLSFAVSSLPILFWKAFTWKPDVIFTVEPPFFCFPGTIIVSKIFHCKVWLHVQDFELDAGFNLGLIPNFNLLKNLVFGIEKFLLRQADTLSSISKEMIRSLQDKVDSAKQILLFPNWVDTQEIYPLEHTSTFRAEQGLGEKQCICLYSGNLGTKQGIEILIESAAVLKSHSEIVFIIAGEGPMRAALESQAKVLKNVRFLDLQPQNRFNDLLNLADIHLLPQSMESNALFFPSKVKAMFASGRPVIATACPDTQLAQVVSGRGIVSEPGNVDQLSRSIQILSADRALRQYYGNAARNYATSHWSKDSILGAVEQSLIDLCKDEALPQSTLEKNSHLVR